MCHRLATPIQNKQIAPHRIYTVLVQKKYSHLHYINIVLSFSTLNRLSIYLQNNMAYSNTISLTKNDSDPIRLLLKFQF